MEIPLTVIVSDAKPVDSGNSEDLKCCIWLWTPSKVLAMVIISATSVSINHQLTFAQCTRNIVFNISNISILGVSYCKRN